MRHVLVTLAVVLLAACSSVPDRSYQLRDPLGNFALDARFALRVLQPGKAAESSSGRLSWVERHGHSHLLIANPLGIGVAEITIQPGHAVLRMGDEADRVSSDADQLMQEVTGQRLPVSKMAGWLRGRPGGADEIQHDSAGRPQHLEVAGWRIDYHYDSDAADALPSRLTMIRPGEVELRLRIEAWSDAP